MIRTPRRFKCYCIGTGKTGTHSIAGIFARNYRAAHEPDAKLLISTVFEMEDGTKPDQDVRSFLRERDERRCLELESDGTLFCFLDLLLGEFPEARFLLTIRDCYSWLNSVFNHNLARRPDGIWRQFDDYQFAPWTFHHAKEERVLEEHGLRTLRHYLNHWSFHNESVIANTPDDRLLVVRTDQIAASAGKIASFLGILPQTLDMTRSHLFKNPTDYGILAKIDPVYLKENVDEYCSSLMCEYFPEIERFDARD